MSSSIFITIKPYEAKCGEDRYNGKVITLVDAPLKSAVTILHMGDEKLPLDNSAEILVERDVKGITLDESQRP